MGSYISVENDTEYDAVNICLTDITDCNWKSLPTSKLKPGEKLRNNNKLTLSLAQSLHITLESSTDSYTTWKRVWSGPTNDSVNTYYVSELFADVVRDWKERDKKAIDSAEADRREREEAEKRRREEFERWYKECRQREETGRKQGGEAERREKEEIESKQMTKKEKLAKLTYYLFQCQKIVNQLNQEEDLSTEQSDGELNA